MSLETRSACRSPAFRRVLSRRTAAALTGGHQLAFWIGAALVGAAIVVAAVVLQREPKPQAEPELRPAYSEA